MNQHFPRPPRLPTQAAEGLPRWRWTLAEFDRFVELGILTEEDRVELIGGEIVSMAAKGAAHEDVRDDLEDWFHANRPKGTRIVMKLGWRPDDQTYCEPDLVVFPRRFRSLTNVPASEVLLLIEVADSTLKKDTTTKAMLYAGMGVREYWAIDAFTRATYVHREPSAQGYRFKRRIVCGRMLRPALLPQLALRLDRLQIDE